MGLQNKRKDLALVFLTPGLQRVVICQGVFPLGILHGRKYILHWPWEVYCLKKSHVKTELDLKEAPRKLPSRTRICSDWNLPKTLLCNYLAVQMGKLRPGERKWLAKVPGQVSSTMTGGPELHGCHGEHTLSQQDKILDRTAEETVVFFTLGIRKVWLPDVPPQGHEEQTPDEHQNS